MSGVRFAPSPTGRFHVGNLRTAWISREWARALGLPWVLRFEDIDTPRVVEGAMELQLRDMEALGLKADRVYLQSHRGARHWELFLRAARSGQVYPCLCSRKEILEALQQSASAPHGQGALYNGACRDRADWRKIPNPTVAWRFRSPEGSGARDFIIARTSPMSAREDKPEESSFVPSYNWACAIDDLDGAYELLVRASDLDHVAGQQRLIQSWIRSEEGGEAGFPAVFHCALVTRDNGERLEKRTRGVTLPELLAAGMEIERLLEIFQRGFVPEPSAFSPAKVWGEARARLTLSGLGIPIP